MFTMDIIDGLTALIGGLPLCHGSGGLTADGALHPSLLKDVENQVRAVLGDKTALSNLIVRVVAPKPESHELTQQRYPETRRMVQIGG